MPSHQHRAGIRVLLHRLLQRIPQVLLTVPFISRPPPTRFSPRKFNSLRSILNNRNRQCIKIPTITPLPAAGFRNRLDLLDIRNLPLLPLCKQRAQHGRLAMRMDTRPRTALLERCHEERRARGGLEVDGLTEVGLCRVVEDKHVGGLETLFLDAGGREENVVVSVGRVVDGYPAAGTGYPAEGVEVAA